jgi:competence protein ComFC
VPKKTSSFFTDYSQLSNFVEEIFFPHFCVVCNKKIEEDYLCSRCKQEIKYLDYPLIERVGNTLFFAITAYEGVMEDAIKKYKFKSYKILSNEFAEIIVKFVVSNKINVDYVGFVPMTRNELLRRGFNQTELLARKIAKKMNAKTLPGLHKVRNTKKQIELRKSERLSNLRNSFEVSNFIKGDILIVDDVYTTGATASELTKALRKKTDGKIIFVALARAIN